MLLMLSCIDIRHKSSTVRVKRPLRHDGVVLKIDDDMLTMRWLKKFKHSLKADKLQYQDNEYDSSGFNAINLNVQDS